MDASDLGESIDFIASNGYKLSPEQRAALQTSLPVLQRHYKFARVVFWGKILCINGEYLIAQGHEKGMTFNNRRTFVSYVTIINDFVLTA